MAGGNALWKGSISFGLVSVPVALRPAEARDELDFHLLDERDLAPIGYRKVNKVTGKEVPSERIVRGFETEDEGQVLVTDEDLERASPERTQRIDIVAFVAGEEIDPIYYDRPYYLAPLGKDVKGYALLRATLQKSGRVGIATVVLHTRQHLAALYARGSVLILNLLRYANEIRGTDGLDVPEDAPKSAGITPKEVEMAQRLVESMVEPWKPESYRDEYRTELLAFLKARAKRGGAPAAEEARTPKRSPAPVIDMMSLLKQSLERGARPKPARRSKSA